MTIEMTKAEAMQNLIDIVDANLSHRIGNFEFDHTERTETQNGTIYLNCVSRDGKTPTYRFKVEHINDKGYNLIWNGDIGIDWGARVILEQSFDAEGNPVNAIIQDNAGVKAACSVSCISRIATETSNEAVSITGYAHASGTEPYDKFSDTLLTVGDLCYIIHTNRIDFFFHFVNKDVAIELNGDYITLKCEGRDLKATSMEICDAVDPADAGITEAEATRVLELMMKNSPFLRS